MVDIDYENLRRQLFRRMASMASPIPPSDREDLFHDTLERTLREGERPLPFERRAAAELRDVVAEHWRSPRRREDPTETLRDEAEPAPGGPDGVLAARAALQAVASAADKRAREYVAYKSARYTDREIAAFPGWTPAAVEATRKQLERSRPAIANLLQRPDSNAQKEAS